MSKTAIAGAPDTTAGPNRGTGSDGEWRWGMATLVGVIRAKRNHLSLPHDDWRLRSRC